MNPKQRAAEAALGFVRSGMTIGLGTGSTADIFLKALANALNTKALADVRGVPTSLRSEKRAIELGIPLTTLAACPRVDLTIDGADEVDPNLDLIKGLGGALVREKIVAQNSRRLIIIADSSKISPRLGLLSPLPVEVVRFAHESQELYLKSLGAKPTLRPGPDGKPLQTDNGNYIYDCRFDGGIEHAAALDGALRRRAGIVDSGLFLGLAQTILIGDAAGVTERNRA